MRMTAGRRVLSVMAMVLGLTVLAGAGPVGAASPAAPSTWKAIPGTQKTKDRPAAVTHAGKVWVFVRGTDDQLHYTRKTATGWTAWASLPSAFPIKDAPALASFKSKLNVFVRRAKDNHLLRRTWNGSAWSTWSDITFTNGTTTSGPGAAVSGGKLLIAVRRPDDTIWAIQNSGTSWGTWAELPGLGKTDLAPTVSDTPDGALVVVNGVADDFAYDNQSTAGVFSGWDPQDLVYTQAPVALASSATLLYEFVRDLDGKIQARTRGVDWTALVDLGATSASGPAATATTTGTLVFIRNATNKVSWNTIVPEAAQ